MKRCVVDTSVALKWYFPEPGDDKALALWDDTERELIAPDFILLEFANAVWKRTRRGDLHKEEAIEVFSEFRMAGLLLFPLTEVAASALEVAASLGCSVYDATYIATAAILECPLITADLKLFRLSASGPFADLVKLLDTWQS